eukprot:scaffold40234_cov68-Phaeocystis_antarctica.AAC.12
MPPRAFVLARAISPCNCVRSVPHANIVWSAERSRSSAASSVFSISSKRLSARCITRSSFLFAHTPAVNRWVSNREARRTPANKRARHRKRRAEHAHVARPHAHGDAKREHPSGEADTGDACHPCVAQQPVAVLLHLDEDEAEAGRAHHAEFASWRGRWRGRQ